MLLGAHMSIAGGVFNAPHSGREVGCEAIQIFTKNANQWKAKPLGEEDVRRFKEAVEETGVWPVVAHDSYLINLASPDPELHEKSLQAFAIEMERAERLGLPFLIFHPGSHVGSGEAAGLKKIARSLDKLHRRTKNYQLKLLLETTAGQGTNLGYTFEQLSGVIGSVKEPERLGICFDTCHTFAAGYDISTEAGYRKVFRELDRVIGLDRIGAFHLNDAKKGLGSRVDRHAHIGQGELGLTPFRCLVNDRRFRKVPKILETPKGKDMAEDRMNLEVLRGLVKKKASSST